MTSISIISAVAPRIRSYVPDTVLEKLYKLLKDADREVRKKDEVFRLEKEIVQLLYDVDDAVEGCKNVIQFKQRSIIPLMAVLRSSNVNLERSKRRLEDKLRELESKITPAAASSSSNETGKTLDEANRCSETKLNPADPNPAAASSTGDQEPAVQIDEKKLKDALFDDNLRVVSIRGDSGVGKSTLAKKAFYDTEVRKHFHFFAWVPVNHYFRTKKVLQDILLKLSPDEEVEIMDMDEVELNLNIFKVLETKRCLVVLEDFQDTQDWQSIRIAFPIDHGFKTSSKILITTTSIELGRETQNFGRETQKSAGAVFEMKLLTEAQCLEILKEEADFDSDDEPDGKIIFSVSGGSPLPAIILGRAFKASDEAARKQLRCELNSRGETSRGATNVLELCYDRLPHEVKPCLLYMGQFPKGKDIEADKLYLLLGAEGLILPEDSVRQKTLSMESPSERQKTLSMESLRNTLEKLARKRLVEAEEDKVSKTRMYKSCQLHDQIRDFCISKAKQEEFFEIVDFKDKKAVEISTRRLAVYLGKHEDGDKIQFKSQDTMKKIRSLLIFDTYDANEESWPEDIGDLKEFSHLRVLDFDRVDFRGRELPKGTGKLILLRHLSFRECYLEKLPSAMSRKFPFLETLDLRVNIECKMTIPNILSNLGRLKHLYFPVSYKSDRNDKLQLRGLEMLEILVNFDKGVCNIEDLSNFGKLQILTIISEGNHNELDGIIKYLDGKANNLQQSSLDIKNFDYYSCDGTTIFGNLLACKSIHSLHIEGWICDSLENFNISPNFTEMVFNGSELEGDPMTVLGNLKDLRSLTLCNDAFLGTEMTISPASKFPELRILKLLNLQYLQKITFEKGVMPKLSTLVIEKCGDLKEVVMSKALDERLRLAQRKKGDDIYFVKPPPTIVNYDNESGNPASTP